MTLVDDAKKELSANQIFAMEMAQAFRDKKTTPEDVLIALPDALRHFAVSMEDVQYAKDLVEIAGVMDRACVDFVTKRIALKVGIAAAPEWDRATSGS